MAIPKQARPIITGTPVGAEPPPPSWWEGMSASFREARRDIPGIHLDQQTSSYNPLIDALLEKKKVPWTYYISPTKGTVSPDHIWADIEEQRRRDPKFLAEIGSREQWEAAEKARVDAAAAADSATRSRTDFVPWLIGSFGAGLTDPFNVGAMALTGGASVGLKTVAQTALREGVVNMVTEAAEQPLIAVERVTQGRPVQTPVEVATSVGLAGLIGGAVGGAGKAIADRIAPHLPALDTETRSAIDVIDRENEIDAGSPFMPDGAGDTVHRDALNETVQALLSDRPALSARAKLLATTSGAGVRPIALPVPRGAEPPVRAQGAALDRIFDALVQQESGGRAGIAGPDTPYGNAHGLTQMLDSTAQGVARKLGIEWRPELMRGTSAEAAAYQRQLGRAYFEEGLARYDGDVRRALMFYHGGPDERLWGPKTRAYADAVLARTGGAPPRAIEGLDAEASAIEQRLRDAIAERDAAEAQLAADPRASVADAFAETSARTIDDLPSPVTIEPTRTVPPMELRQVPASQVTVDAKLMQFKSGGDEFGVTERLQGVTEWNPLLGGRVMLWERADGALIVADGHQRVGLARRIGAGEGRDIALDAIVLRERDGITASQARLHAALKNIAEGTGTAIDAAKVIREAGRQVLDMLPPRSVLVRDGAALARLSDDAFGAVVNQVVKPEYAAIVGRLLPDDPKAHLGMIDLLAKTEPANRTQAEAIVRQGIAAGFVDGEQVDMFGTLDTRASLFLERAKVLDGALAELRKRKTVFRMAAREAGTLEAVGQIDAERSAAEALTNDQAIELIQRLSTSAGPIKDAIDAAARALADGKPRAAVVKQLVDDLGKIDARTAMVVRDHASAADAARSGEEPAPRDVDTDTFSLFGDPVADRGAVAQAQSLAHDVRAAAPAKPAEGGAEKAPAPLSGAAPIDPDQPIRLSEEGETVTPRQIIEQIDAEDAAIGEVKSCL